MIKYKLYTDGGCRNNGNKNAIGAWSFIILDDKNNIFNEDYFYIEPEDKPTNIRCEMIAIIQGLKNIIMQTNIENINSLLINVYTDSKFICDCFNLHWIDNWISNNWIKADKTKVQNKDLWEELINLEALIGIGRIKFTYIKGHDGDKYNEYCDLKVNEAMNFYEKGEK